MNVNASGGTLAVGDLAGLLAELLEVAPPPAALGEQRVGLREAPPRELDRDAPAVDTAKLPAALGTRARRALAHPLEELEAVAVLAAVLVQRHPPQDIHRGFHTSGRTCPPWGNRMGIITAVWFPSAPLRRAEEVSAIPPRPKNSQKFVALPCVPGMIPR